MEKLVCESLQEYRLLLEADDDSKPGMASGIAKAITTAPGRVLRSWRTRGIIQKYKLKLFAKINAIPAKYIPSMTKLINNTRARIEKVEASGVSEDNQSRQKKEILEDMVDYMKGLLTKLKDAMDAQVKVYDEALNKRLERAGTITGVEFFPEEKTRLLSQWTTAVNEVNNLIQQKIIALMDNDFIAQYQEIKADLEEYINDSSPYTAINSKTSVDPSVVKDSNEVLIKESLEKLGFIARTPYVIKDRNAFIDDGVKPKEGDVFMYDFAPTGNLFYQFIRNKKVVPHSKQFFRRPDDTEKDWKARLGRIQLAIQKPAEPATTTAQTQQTTNSPN